MSVRYSVKASQVRVRQAPRRSIDESALPMPKQSPRPKPRDQRFDAEKLKTLWRDPQRLKQILGESDPD